MDWSHVYRVIVDPQLVLGCFLCCLDLSYVYNEEMHFINFLLIMCITWCRSFMHRCSLEMHLTELWNALALIM